MTRTERIVLPPWTETTDGLPRRVGVELEMSGLTLDELASHVADALSLSVREDGRYQRRLDGDEAGEWIVEFDFRYLKELGRRDDLDSEWLNELRRSAEDALRLVAERVVPIELVSPPLPMQRLGEIESLVERLRNAGATGTSHDALYAFGMQLNPELPALDAPTIRAYLQAFLCLYDWLYVRANVDMTRRLTAFAEPFPAAYVRHMIAPGYAPDVTTLTDDYLAHNPTRNRALDLLPLLAEIDETRVRAVVDDPLIKPRPTLHYRLPNCEIDRTDWGFATVWNDWLEVERLAADAERLAACCQAYSAFMDRPVSRWFGHWEQEVEKHWLAR